MSRRQDSVSLFSLAIVLFQTMRPAATAATATDSTSKPTKHETRPRRVAECDFCKFMTPPTRPSYTGAVRLQSPRNESAVAIVEPSGGRNGLRTVALGLFLGNFTKESAAHGNRCEPS